MDKKAVVFVISKLEMYSKIQVKCDLLVYLLTCMYLYTVFSFKFQD